MPRVLIRPHELSDSTITIVDPDTLHHVARVLRARVGDAVECFDGQGHVAAGRVASCGRAAVRVDVTRRWREPPARRPVTLAAALLKPERFDWMVEKATELGASRICPLVTQRTTVRAARGGAPSRLARWMRIAESAAAQCGRAWLPIIEDPRPLSDALEHVRESAGLFLVAGERGAPILQAIEQAKAASALTIWVGPEGDFTPEESALARRHGCVTVWLGPAVLRAETAAVAALSIAQCALVESSS